MCALQFASQLEQKQIDKSEDFQAAFERLSEMDEKLSALLAK